MFPILRTSFADSLKLLAQAYNRILIFRIPQAKTSRYLGQAFVVRPELSAIFERNRG